MVSPKFSITGDWKAVIIFGGKLAEAFITIVNIAYVLVTKSGRVPIILIT